ncbi:MAG: hypothetical protein P8X96_11770 [Desulfobacteraceae bacterium]
MEKGALPDVVSRQPPDVQLGTDLLLFDKPAILSSILIDKKGAAHVFAVDQGRQLYHLQIIDDKIITREFLDKIENKHTQFIDAVEYPPGKLRVLAGDKQYIQVAPNGDWKEIKRNQCEQFVPVADKLLCAFVIEGEKIEAPERTDYTFGWFLLVPIVYWSHEHASKLVLAEESPEGWIILAVVDPDTTMDADSDFLVETDRIGNIHFLYSTSRGGGGFFVFAYGYSGGAAASKPKSELRYAQLRSDQLLAQSTIALNQVLNRNATPTKWISVKGVSLEAKPCVKKDYNYYNASIVLNPLKRKFLVNQETGNINGLMLASQCTLADDTRELPMLGPNQSVVEVSLRDGQWSPHFNIVTANDFPTSGILWNLDNLSIKRDGKGKFHLLLPSLDPGWKNRKYINYLLKDDTNWSAPLILGRGDITINVISFAVDDSGVAFAAWVNAKGEFIGKWIKPRTGR